MPLNIAQALKDGHTKKEINEYLSPLHNFNIEEARKDYDENEIFSHLSRLENVKQHEKSDRPTGMPLADVAGELERPEMLTAENVGGIFGEVAGGRFGPGGRIAGSMVGGMLGNFAKQLHDRFADKEPVPIDMWETMTEGALQAGYTSVGEFFGAMGRAMKKPFQLVMEKGAPAAKRLVAKYNAKFTVAKTSQNRILDWLESYSKGSILGGGIIVESERQVEEAIANAMRDFVDTFGTAKIKGEQLTRSELAAAVADIMNESDLAFKKFAEALYAGLDKHTKGTMEKVAVSELVDTGLVDPRGMPILRENIRYQTREVGGIRPIIDQPKKWARKLLKERERLGRIGYSEEGMALINDVASLPRELTWREAHILRSNLLDELNKYSKKDKAYGITKKMIGMIDGAMHSAAKKFDPHLLKTWRATSAFYGKGKETFQKKWLKQIRSMAAGEDNTRFAEDVGKNLFQAERTAKVEYLFNAVKKIDPDGRFINNPEGISMIRAGYVDEMFRRARDPITNEFNGKRLIKWINDPITEKILGKDALKNLHAIRDAIAIEQGLVRKTVTGGSMVAQLQQAGGIIQIVFGVATQDPADVAMGSTLILGPALIAHIIADTRSGRFMGKALTTLLKTPANMIKNPRVNSMVGRFLGEVLRKKIEIGERPKGEFGTSKSTLD